MNISYNFRVFNEIDKIREYYEEEADPELADDFYLELRQLLRATARNREIEKSIDLATMAYAG